MSEVLEYKSVKNEIQKAILFTDFVGTSFESEEAKINKFLDTISEFRNDLERLNLIFNKLDSELLKCFNTLSYDQKQDLLPQLKSIREKSLKLYTSFMKSPINVGLKSVLSDLRLNIDVMKEVVEDIEIVEELSNDNDFDNLLKSIIE